MSESVLASTPNELVKSFRKSTVSSVLTVPLRSNTVESRIYEPMLTVMSVIVRVSVTAWESKSTTVKALSLEKIRLFNCHV